MRASALFAIASPALADDAKDAKPAGDAKAEGPKDAKAQEQARIQSFSDMLKKQDPEAHKRFAEVRETLDKSRENLKKTQEELAKAAGEEKINIYQEYKLARKKYAEAHLAFIAFLNERDQKRIVLIEENIKKLETAKEQIKGVLEARTKAREELLVDLKKME